MPVLPNGTSDGSAADAQEHAHLFTLFDFGKQKQTNDFEQFMGEKLFLDLLERCSFMLPHVDADKRPHPVLNHYLSDSGTNPVHVLLWRMQALPGMGRDGFR